MRHILALTVLVIHSLFGVAQSLSNELRCRSCINASNLSECTHQIICDNRFEECYMDKVITDQLTVVYNGGCRAKTICNLAASVGRKRNMVSCSRCCNTDDCNSGVCGLTGPTAHILSTTTSSPYPQCYACDHRHYSQYEVQNPKDCTNLDYCQTNEVCSTTETENGGRVTYVYGCRSKLHCQILMKTLFEEYKVCVANVTAPPPGSTWMERCGAIVKRSTTLCHSCCADSACNYGSCKDQNNRLFKLALSGYFDFSTLKTF